MPQHPHSDDLQPPEIRRRTFLMGALGAAAGASVWRPRRAAANDRIGIAVIGCRNRGHQVAQDCLKSGQFDLITMCDCDTAMIDRGLKELRGTLRGTPGRETDFRRVLEDPRVDAIINATPDHWHAGITTRALDAGKHVYLEKPASYNFADGQAMVASQAAHPGLTVLVGTQQRSGPHFVEARDFIRSGALGKIGFCRTWIIQDRGRLEAVPDRAPPETLDYPMWLGPAPMKPYNENRVHYVWRFIHDYGTGEMGNWGAHWIDIALWYLGLGFPEMVSGHGGQWVADDAKEWPDTQTVLYHYPELTLLWEQRIWSTYGIQELRNGIELGGDKGSITLNRSGWTFYPKDGRLEKHGGSEQGIPHVTHFADCIRGHATPVADIQAGHLTAGLCHLGNISAALNRPLRFDPASERFPDDAEANTWLERADDPAWTG